MNRFTQKTASLTSDLVATKGHASVTTNVALGARAQENTANVPLNFRVPNEFRRRFRVFAAAHDLKLSELLQLAFRDYETLSKKNTNS